ncbi:hypothetical protein JNUCC83_12305 (plasmid) [Vagococcus sp. JNUCC 83]
MDYLFTTVLWFIFSVIGYAAFWKDWKNLKKMQRWFLVTNLGLSLFAIANYFI